MDRIWIDVQSVKSDPRTPLRDYVKKNLKYCDFDPIIKIVGPIEKPLLTVDDFSGLWMRE